MAPATTPLPPGSMTVPPLFGWEHIVTVLLLVVAVAVVFLLVSAAGSNPSARAEWRAFLDARSHGSAEPAKDVRDESSSPPGPSRVVTTDAAELLGD